MSTDDTYADPQDLQFGEKAAEDQQRVDELSGEDTGDLGEEPSGSPRPAGKAEPTE